MLLPLMAMPARAAAPPAYPARDVLTAFAAACAGVDQADSGRATALAAGWREADPEPGGQLATLLSEAKAALAREVAREGPAEALPGAVLFTEVGGRSLALVTSGVVMEGMVGRGCRVYDFAAPEKIALDELKSWAGREPNQYETREGMTRAVWNPGLKTGQMEMEVSFVAPDAPIRKHPLFRSLSGVVLVATAIDLRED
jgi:hypothetical protein